MIYNGEHYGKFLVDQKNMTHVPVLPTPVTYKVESLILCHQVPLFKCRKGLGLDTVVFLPTVGLGKYKI